MFIIVVGQGKVGTTLSSQLCAEGHDIGHSVKEAVVNAGLDVEDVVVHVEPWRDNGRA